MSLYSPSTSTASRQVTKTLKAKTVQRVYSLIEWLWCRMAFLKRKRVKFSVDLQVCHLTDVPLVNAILFAKCRLLDSGSFQGVTERAEVVNHSTKWEKRFTFTCRIPSDPNTGILERCSCRISIRKEQRGGRSYEKLGYVDINLSEFAASGIEGLQRSYLLDGYGLNTRQDNSKVAVKVTMCHQSADPFFRVPHQSSIPDDSALNPEERRAPMGEEEEEDAESMGTAYEGVAFRTPVDPQGPDGSGGSSSLAGADDAVSVASETRRGAGGQAVGGGGSGGGGGGTPVMGGTGGREAQTAAALRRLSADRNSAPRVQSTRIDAEGVIASVLAGSRLSEELSGDQESGEGLALFLGRDGEAVVASPAGVHTRHLERVHISADTSGGPL